MQGDDERRVLDHAVVQSFELGAGLDERSEEVLDGLVVLLLCGVDVGDRRDAIPFLGVEHGHLTGITLDEKLVPGELGEVEHVGHESPFPLEEQLEQDAQLYLGWGWISP